MMENALLQVLISATIAFAWFEAGRAVESRKRDEAELKELRRTRQDHKSDKKEED